MTQQKCISITSKNFINYKLRYSKCIQTLARYRCDRNNMLSCNTRISTIIKCGTMCGKSTNSNRCRRIQETFWKSTKRNVVIRMCIHTRIRTSAQRIRNKICNTRNSWNNICRTKTTIRNISTNNVTKWISRIWKRLRQLKTSMEFYLRISRRL